MAIRQFVAKQLHNVATSIEKDKSKEKLGKTIFAVRVGVANAIMPKMPLANR